MLSYILSSIRLTYLITKTFDEEVMIEVTIEKLFTIVQAKSILCYVTEIVF